jgi:Na+/H+ antiporter NhaD/arsenite permease-like protein
MRRAWLFTLLLILTTALLACGRFVGIPLDRPQVESLSIFCALILGILLYDERRLAISLAGVAGLLALGLLSVEQFVASAGLDVVLFLLGTFLVAGYLEQSRFFEHLVSQIVRAVGPRPELLLGALMLAGMIASAIVGEVAAILFVGGAMLHIASRCKLKGAPFLMMLVFAINTGSAATEFGPVGITIALKSHLGVFDFFRWATPIALVVLVLVFGICRWWFAEEFRTFAEAVHREHASLKVPDTGKAGKARVGWGLVGSMTVLLVFHEQIEGWMGLSANVMLLAAALGAGAAALLLSGDGAKELIEERVDWATLAFFLMLFSAVGALVATGVTGTIAGSIMHLTGGRPAELTLVVGWATGFLSALLANMLAVAAFLPIVAQLKAQGAACPTSVYWLMLFGATFMGNMTSIGSTCNIIACGMSEKRGHGVISFIGWLKIGIIVSLASMLLATLLLALQTRGLSAG